jgi:hypothetical protein
LPDLLIDGGVVKIKLRSGRTEQRVSGDMVCPDFAFRGSGYSTSLNAKVGDKFIIDVYLASNVRT